MSYSIVMPSGVVLMCRPTEGKQSSLINPCLGYLDLGIRLVSHHDVSCKKEGPLPEICTSITGIK